MCTLKCYSTKHKPNYHLQEAAPHHNFRVILSLCLSLSLHSEYMANPITPPPRHLETQICSSQIVCRALFYRKLIRWRVCATNSPSTMKWLFPKVLRVYNTIYGLRGDVLMHSTWRLEWTVSFYIISLSSIFSKSAFIPKIAQQLPFRSSVIGFWYTLYCTAYNNRSANPIRNTWQ